MTDYLLTEENMLKVRHTKTQLIIFIFQDLSPKFQLIIFFSGNIDLEELSIMGKFDSLDLGPCIT